MREKGGQLFASVSTKMFAPVSHPVNIAKRNLRTFLITRAMRLLPKIAKKNIFITCQRNDGGGAQIHGRFSTLAFCIFFGLDFFNSPIKGAHFAEGQDWDSRWNSMLTLGQIPKSEAGELVRADTHKVVSAAGVFLFLAKRLVSGNSEPALLSVESAHDWSDGARRFLDSLRSEFQKALVAPAHHRSGGVVIHVRGGTDSTASIRKVAETEIFSMCRELIKLFPADDITIYSNSPLTLPADLKEECKVDLDSSPFMAIGHMIHAEVLVIAKSSMSYVAALACEGSVYAPEFWHPRLPSWKRVDTLTAKRKKRGC